MEVLLVGSGGREHALAWALSASPLLRKLWAAPGNPGIAEIAECVPVAAEDVAGLVAFARDKKIDLVVPGPEAPLVAGLADALAAAGIRCCGPSAAAARLEGSKSFAHAICDEAGIPTARWEAFDDAEAAIDFIRRRGAPLVVKADGLAAGKGVVVAATEAEAETAVHAMMRDAAFGAAGERLVIEECLEGNELSVFALCDGLDAIFLGAARDHKRAGDGDTGPNTGGMGAISPPPEATEALAASVMERIVRPALAALAARGAPFRGVLFAGLMLTADGAKVIEFNARWGDPEAQCLLPRLRSDLLPALVAACDGELARFDLRWREEASVAVVIASRGYPGAYRAGGALHGLAAAAALPGVLVFQAGTRIEAGVLMAAGGRVLTVVGRGADLVEARARAYAGVAAAAWEGGFWRSDIGGR
ncbi:MAG TPA: phosphoribosylamine--glycine ligase [Acetobacteraceae bacterium]|jgi:phosphoribosylamine--glycine ligase|nr:phosphoribosylamine--glycine ligase [Acetobacteraceae bacterium]